jgi:transcriptional regulator with GAF, ATPase, and Fis domain
LVSTFLALTDTRAADFAPMVMLQHLVEQCSVFFEGADAGIILKMDDGTLAVIASSSSQARVTDVLELSVGEGPCIEAVHDGVVVHASDADEIRTRWPRFAVRADAVGYQAVHAVPLRLRETILGSLNLFLTTAGGLDESDAATARALADMASIGLLQNRALTETQAARARLEYALETQVLIEQAKGMLSVSLVVTIDEASEILRLRARADRMSLRDVAQLVVTGAFDSPPE